MSNQSLLFFSGYIENKNIDQWLFGKSSVLFFFFFEDLDEEFGAFRALLTDSGFYFNAPLNVYINRDSVYTGDGKSALNDVIIGDLLEENDNEKKVKNDAYRKIYPWQMISGRLFRCTTGDESCYTPVLDKCNTKEKGQSKNDEEISMREGEMIDL